LNKERVGFALLIQAADKVQPELMIERAADD
jgi:hypothetical protein